MTNSYHAHVQIEYCFEFIGTAAEIDAVPICLYFFNNLISTHHLTVLIRGVILHLEQMRRSCVGVHNKRKQCTYSLQMFLQNID